MDLKSTLNLPDPEFTIPMKADLATREPAIQARWDSGEIYHRIMEARQGQPTFLLHDGPPYTNSPIHLGTAMNKMLKDFVVKSRTMMGFRTPYVPGFDNHGLPIEQAVLTAWADEVKADPVKLKELGFQEKPSDVALNHRLKEEIVELRTRCRAHAERYLDVQRDQFKRLGVFGLWEKPYTTMSFKYEAEIVRVFKRLVQADQVYRGLRPVLWSPTSRTALADTEIVYAEHTSKAIYVRFALKSDPEAVLCTNENVFTIIWTTTPWTIPANLACAFHPELTYVLVEASGARYLILEELMEKVLAACNLGSGEVLQQVRGEELEKLVFAHPVFGRDSRAVLADYVTTEDGTGVVHTAPGHGREDFITGLKYNLDILCPVDERGMLTAEAGEFEGLFYKQCDKVVVERLQELGALLTVSDYVHQYPHAERDGQPVIFRATHQWFVSIDANDLRERMVDAIYNKVTWHPGNSVHRIGKMIENRPDWCISRQRPWGVGLPIFYGKESGVPVMDPVAIEAVAKLVETEGSDAWFLRSPEEILPAGYKHPQTEETEFIKEVDVFDVWFDSGSTHLCVLEGNVEPAWKAELPADLYLEGSDQHRGWFNTSLVIGMGTRGEAPYKQVVTHGFVVDENNEKMSKRKGNVIDPVEVSNKLGADILRYWCASVDYPNDVPCGENILKQCGENYRTIRNTFRFLLGNLKGFVEKEPDAIYELDQWVMEQTDLLVADCVDAYSRYDFTKVLTSVHNFCSNEISKFYLDSIKDRMYCDLPEWASRRSGQWACRYVLIALVKLVAPILVHTAEEVYQLIPMVGRLESVHLETFDSKGIERVEEIAGGSVQERFARMLGIRSQVFAQFEQWKSQANVKDSQGVITTISTSEDEAEFLKSFAEDIANYFKMSWVEIQVGEPSVSFAPSPFMECSRSRLRRPDVAEVSVNGSALPLSKRDQRALAELGLVNQA
ncbi:MAG: isoleucine--tRNA ligase [Armatimonadetes bacterium]|nr:isoleucine--tRNA ligase [Armatimonadota bacterium]